MIQERPFLFKNDWQIILPSAKNGPQKKKRVFGMREKLIF